MGEVRRVVTGSRLAAARKLRGRTKKSVAEAVGISPSSLTDYENEKRNPPLDILRRLSTELKFSVSFFNQDEIVFPEEGALAFRARSKMTSVQRGVASTTAALAIELSDWMELNFILPDASLPDLSEVGSAEEAAAVLRQMWVLGQGPVIDMIGLLESHGVRVFSVTETSRSVDAFSYWDEHRGRPFVFLTTSKSGERRRMDAAHELGHLVLHRKVEQVGEGNRELEHEANAFASAFLMPREGFLTSTPTGFTLSKAMSLKTQWRVSVSAFVYRAHTLGLLTDWQYHDLFRKIGAQGMRSQEPNGVTPEVSKVDSDVIRLSGGPVGVAEQTKMPVSVISSLTFKSPGVLIEGEKKSSDVQTGLSDIHLVK